MTETRAMSTSPRRSAVDLVSMRPDGSGRGRLAVARIAAATSLVRGVACMGGLPNILDRPAMVRRTPGCAQGSSRLASRCAAAMAAQESCTVDMDTPEPARSVR